jgi:hypothetical protein
MPKPKPMTKWEKYAKDKGEFSTAVGKAVG